MTPFFGISGNILIMIDVAKLISTKFPSGDAIKKVFPEIQLN